MPKKEKEDAEWVDDDAATTVAGEKLRQANASITAN